MAPPRPWALQAPSRLALRAAARVSNLARLARLLDHGEHLPARRLGDRQHGRLERGQRSAPRQGGAQRDLVVTGLQRLVEDDREIAFRRRLSCCPARSSPFSNSTSASGAALPATTTDPSASTRTTSKVGTPAPAGGAAGAGAAAQPPLPVVVLPRHPLEARRLPSLPAAQPPWREVARLPSLQAAMSLAASRLAGVRSWELQGRTALAPADRQPPPPSDRKGRDPVPPRRTPSHLPRRYRPPGTGKP